MVHFSRLSCHHNCVIQKTQKKTIPVKTETKAALTSSKFSLSYSETLFHNPVTPHDFPKKPSLYRTLLYTLTLPN